MKRSLILCAAVTLTLVSFAAEYTWKGGSSGVWADSGNWEGDGGWPKAGDTAVFTATTEITGDGFDISKDGAEAENLVLSIAAGATLTMNVSISGEGGVERTGDGTLKLMKTNPFTGVFISHGTTAQALGRTYVYASDALGTDSADFYYDYRVDKTKPSTSTYAPLYLDAGGGTLTNSCEISISYNNNAMNNGLNFSNGKFVFNGKVKALGRMDVGVASNVTEIRFNEECEFSSGAWVDMTGFPSGCHVYFAKAWKPTAAWYCSSSSCTFHFGSQGNDFIYYTSRTIDNTLVYYGMAQTKYVCETNDVFTSRTRLGSFGWDNGTSSNESRIDLNGFDQRFPVLKDGSTSTATDFGFTSPVDRPAAQVILEGKYVNDIWYTGWFFGKAGLCWNPSDDSTKKLFVLSNAVSATSGDLTVGNGSLRLAGTASFTGLGKLTVGATGVLEVEQGAGTKFLTQAAEVADGGKIRLGRGVRITCKSLTVGGQEIPEGVYRATEDESDFLEGEGELEVWTGEAIAFTAAAGDWNDPANWSLGRVPGERDAVTVTGAKKVLFGETAGASPRLRALYLEGGATLTFSTNWNTCVNADEIRIDNATVTCTGGFTNELDKTRIWLACETLTVTATGKIDADKQGWSGGLMTGEPDVSGNVHVQVSNCDGLKRGGWGPGRGRTDYMPAAHFGIGGWGAYSNARCLCYDDPFEPREPGSGGFGMGDEQYGVIHVNKTSSNGGGAIRIEATGKVTVDGQVLASAGGVCTHWYFNKSANCNNGGSGGSVYIRCAQIAGTGEIRADGGDGNYAVKDYCNYEPTLVSNPALPGGGGGIAICYDPAVQPAGACRGLTISAVGGTFRGVQVENKSGSPMIEGTVRRFGTMDRYRTDAEPGTLVFTDDKLVADTIGTGLSGRLVNLQEYVHEGDLNLTYGHVRFATTGVTVRVTGNLTIDGEWARLDLGGVYTVTNWAMMPYVSAGDRPVSLTVDGDVTVRNGAALGVYAGATGFASWGGEVAVGGTFTVGAGGHVYPTTDFGNGGSPHFVAGAFALEEGGEVDADWRGGSGGWSSGDYNKYAQSSGGIGPASGGKYGAGYEGGGGGHGGNGGWSLKDGAVYPNADWRTAYGQVNDDCYQPTHAGAGGGCGGYGRGGAGGGVFHLASTGTVSVAGRISANGLHPSVSNMYDFYAGAGAGGTIFLAGGTLTGAATAVLSAHGGDSGVGNRSGHVSACGAGGRVSLWGGYGRVLNGEKYKARHNATEPVFADGNGLIDWQADLPDVSGGTNILRTTEIDQYPATHGAAGTFFFNVATDLPGTLLFVR